MNFSASSESDWTDHSPLIVTLSYCLMLLLSGGVLATLAHFWGDLILISFDEITGVGLSSAGLASVWLLFVWALVLCVVIHALTQDRLITTESRVILLMKGAWLSLNAGVFEELIYRWFVFASSMIVLPFFNFITFGLVKWFYTELLIPVANFMTLELLQPYLYHPASWTVGAALVMASVRFRDDHENHGFLGKINVWFIGMLMFWLVFNYGLLTAMAAHVIYDLVVFGYSALTAKRYTYYSSRLYL